jgi:tetratricopeptide (TPR) repeat protein
LSAFADIVYLDDSVGNLYTGDPATGAFTFVGNSGAIMGGGFADITFSGGVLYGVDSNAPFVQDFYSIDTATAAKTLLGNTWSAIDINGMGTNASGVIFAGGDRNIYTINKTNGLATAVAWRFCEYHKRPGIGGYASQVLVGELEKSRYISVLPDARISQTLRLMARPADSKLSPEIASEICERTGSAAMVESSIARLGREYLLNLRARNCRTGDVLDEEQATAAKKEDVFTALGQVVNRFQNRAGEALPRVQKEPSLSAEVTTASLEAWRSYSAAMKAQERSAQTAEVIPLLKRAVELDPQFAMAYANLGREYASFGESDLGAQNIAKGYELRNRVSNQENYFITFNYHRQVTRNLELARQTLESWAQETPKDLMPHGFLAAFTSQGSGHYDRAVEEGQKAIELDPDYSIGYENMAFAYLYLNRLTEAEGDAS